LLTTKSTDSSEEDGGDGSVALTSGALVANESNNQVCDPQAVFWLRLDNSELSSPFAQVALLAYLQLARCLPIAYGKSFKPT